MFFSSPNPHVSFFINYLILQAIGKYIVTRFSSGPLAHLLIKFVLKLVLSQKVTYLFVIGALELEWFKNAKFRQ